MAMVSFLGLIAIMLPAAFFVGGADKITIEAGHGKEQSVGEAIREFQRAVKGGGKKK